MAVAIVAHCRRLNGARNCVKGKQFGDRNTAHKRNHGESPNNTSCETQTQTCAYERAPKIKISNVGTYSTAHAPVDDSTMW